MHRPRKGGSPPYDRAMEVNRDLAKYTSAFGQWQSKCNHAKALDSTRLLFDKATEFVCKAFTSEVDSQAAALSSNIENVKESDWAKELMRTSKLEEVKGAWAKARLTAKAIRSQREELEGLLVGGAS